MKRRLFLSLLSAVVLAGCQPRVLPPERAIVILISIDGFRADYLDRLQPPNLMKLAAAGVRADGLIPQFPSKTFPNHYTIVTGLTLAHHGIISNNMRAKDIPGEFEMSNREVIADPRWWGGEPIWNTAERQGRKAASMFWPGSETAIGGHQATYWVPFDDHMSHAARVGRIIDWLKLPEDIGPSRSLSWQRTATGTLRGAGQHGSMLPSPPLELCAAIPRTPGRAAPAETGAAGPRTRRAAGPPATTRRRA